MRRWFGMLFCCVFLSARAGAAIEGLVAHSVFYQPQKEGAPPFVELAWEAKSIHGLEVGQGLRAAFAPHSSRKSLVISYTAKTDVQLFNDSGTQLAMVNSSGGDLHCLDAFPALNECKFKIGFDSSVQASAILLQDIIVPSGVEQNHHSSERDLRSFQNFSRQM